MTYKNPALTVDLLIIRDGRLLLVSRRNPPLGWALPGGFVDEGESLAGAALREAEEETGLPVRLEEQFHAYSDPQRDPRKHTVSVVFIATAEGEPQAGDDAAEVRFFPLESLPELVFDHAKIIGDYLAYRQDGKRPGAMT